jgi:hypothetical protein
MEIGQIVYLRPVETGDAYRRDKKVKTSTITKIGRKYITVERFGQFEISNGIQKTNFSCDYALHLNENELNLHLEREDLTRKIKNSLPAYGKWDLEIEKLREIATILNCR